MAARESGRGSAKGELGPLPGGRHGLSRRQVVESQRERLLAALAHLVAERGYRATTISEIVRAASVSGNVFYEHFSSKEECFLAVFDAVETHLRELIAAAVAEQPDWPARAVAALRAATRFFAAEPELARLFLIEPITASPEIAAHFRAVVLSAVPYLRAGRDERPEASLPESTEELLLGGLVALLARSVLAGEGGALEGRLPDLIDFTLAPYLGAGPARRLATQSA